MKRTRTYVLLLLSALSFTACKWQIPEKVSVRTNADYKLSIGSIEKDFTEDVNINQLVSKDLGIPNAKLYDYFPGEKNPEVQQFLMKLPLMEVPVDIGKYFNESDISSAVQEMSFEKEIEIPEIKVDNRTEISLDSINDSLNSMFTCGGIIYTQPASLLFLADFGTVVYETGELILEGFGNTIPDGTGVSITVDGNIKYSSFSDNKAYLDISGLNIRKENIIVSFSVFSFQDYGKAYKGTISPSSKIKTISGITIPVKEADLTDVGVVGLQLPPELKSPIKFPINTSVDLPDSFAAATLREASLTTEIDIPWAGAELEYGINTTGVINTSAEKNSEKVKVMSLDGQTITSGTVNLDAEIEVAFNNAVIDFTKKPVIGVAAEIKSFESISIDATGFETSLQESQKFPKEVFETLKEIKLNPSGIKGSYTNTFPAGNDISLVASSKFFGIAGDAGKVTFESGKTDEAFDIMSTETKVVSLDETPDVSNNVFDSWDFDLNIKLPGDGINPNRITVSGVEPGKKYKIGMKVTPVLDWDSIKIKVPDFNTGDQNQSLGINFGDLFKSISDTVGISDFGKKIQLSDILLYIRAEKPGLEGKFDSLGFKGDVELYYAKEDGTKVLDSTGNPISEKLLDNAVLNFVDKPLPEFVMKNNSLITDVTSDSGNFSMDPINLGSLINKSFEVTEGELNIKYNIGLQGDGNEIEIKKSDLESEGDNSGSIAVTAFIQLPLSFKVAGPEPLEFDITSLMNTETTTDIFGRTEPKSVADLEDYMNAIESCGVRYTIGKLPFKSEMELGIDLKTGEGLKNHSIKNGELVVTREQIEKILAPESYPYMPKVCFTIPANTDFSLPRELAMQMNVTLLISTDGTIEIMGGKK